MQGNPYKIENAFFYPNPDQRKAIYELLDRLGQVPKILTKVNNNAIQIQQNKQNIANNLQKIKKNSNSQYSPALNLSRINQDQFEWLRWERNNNLYTRYPNGGLGLLIDGNYGQLEGTVLTNVTSNVAFIDCSQYDDGYIIFIRFDEDDCLVYNEPGLKTGAGAITHDPNYNPYGGNGYGQNYIPAQVNLSTRKNAEDVEVFNEGDILVLQLDEGAFTWHEIGRNKREMTADQITSTPYQVKGESFVSVDTSSSGGAVDIDIHPKDKTEGRELTIVDDGDNASSNNITFTETDGSTTYTIYTIDLDGGYVQLRYDGSQWHIVSEYQDTSTGGVNFEDVDPNLEVIQSNVYLANMSPTRNFVLFKWTDDSVIQGINPGSYNAGDIVRVKFERDSSAPSNSTCNLAVVSSGNFQLKGQGFTAYDSVTSKPSKFDFGYPVESGTEFVFIFDGNYFREVAKYDETGNVIYDAQLIGIKRLSFRVDQINSNQIDGSNTPAQSYIESGEGFSILDYTINSDMDGIRGPYQDGAIVTVRFSQRTLVHNDIGPYPGKIFLTAGHDMIFSGQAQLTLQYYASNDHWREIGHTRTNHTATIDGNTPVNNGNTKYLTKGEHTFYVDTANTSGDAYIAISQPDITEGKTIRIKDIGNNAGSSHIVVELDNGNDVEFASSYSMTNNGESLTLTCDGNNYYVV